MEKQPSGREIRKRPVAASPPTSAPPSVVRPVAVHAGVEHRDDPWTGAKDLDHAKRCVARPAQALFPALNGPCGHVERRGKHGLRHAQRSTKFSYVLRARCGWRRRGLGRPQRQFSLRKGDTVTQGGPELIEKAHVHLLRGHFDGPLRRTLRHASSRACTANARRTFFSDSLRSSFWPLP